MVIYGDRIEMIPLRKLSEMKGFLKGIDTAWKGNLTGYEYHRFIGLA